jgi:hypothetical protein
MVRTQRKHTTSATEPKAQTRMTLTEWGAIADLIGGEGRRDTPFKCPLCGNVATPRMWKDAGGDPDRAVQECIGRLIGAKGGLNSAERPVPQPCDWAAFGLFVIGDTILLDMENGNEIRVFPFDPDALSAARPPAAPGATS